jgi:hypothetical protein
MQRCAIYPKGKTPGYLPGSSLCLVVLCVQALKEFIVHAKAHNVVSHFAANDIHDGTMHSNSGTCDNWVTRC